MSIPGVIAKKLGMSSEFTSDGRCIPVTYLQVADDCAVIDKRTEAVHGYSALVIGAQSVKAEKLSKPVAHAFAKTGTTPRAIVKEFRVAPERLEAVLVGTEINASDFVPGQRIDVTGTSTGKGFAGGMKRHGFSGLRATHGVSVSHRSHGSTGQRQDPGKVFKGKKMAGHLGDKKVTVKQLEVIRTDQLNNVLVVRGAVPGKAGGRLVVRFSN